MLELLFNNFGRTYVKNLVANFCPTMDKNNIRYRNGNFELEDMVFDTEALNERLEDQIVRVKYARIGIMKLTQLLSKTKKQGIIEDLLIVLNIKKGYRKPKHQIAHDVVKTVHSMLTGKTFYSQKVKREIEQELPNESEEYEKKIQNNFHSMIAQFSMSIKKLTIQIQFEDDVFIIEIPEISFRDLTKNEESNKEKYQLKIHGIKLGCKKVEENDEKEEQTEEEEKKNEHNKYKLEGKSHVFAFIQYLRIEVQPEETHIPIDWKVTTVFCNIKASQIDCINRMLQVISKNHIDDPENEKEEKMEKKPEEIKQAVEDIFSTVHKELLKTTTKNEKEKSEIEDNYLEGLQTIEENDEEEEEEIIVPYGDQQALLVSDSEEEIEGEEEEIEDDIFSSLEETQFSQMRESTLLWRSSSDNYSDGIFKSALDEQDHNKMEETIEKPSLTLTIKGKIGNLVLHAMYDDVEIDILWEIFDQTHTMKEPLCDFLKVNIKDIFVNIPSFNAVEAVIGDLNIVENKDDKIETILTSLSDCNQHVSNDLGNLIEVAITTNMEEKKILQNVNVKRPFQINVHPEITSKLVQFISPFIKPDSEMTTTTTTENVHVEEEPIPDIIIAEPIEEKVVPKISIDDINHFVDDSKSDTSSITPQPTTESSISDNKEIQPIKNQFTSNLTVDTSMIRLFIKCNELKNRDGHIFKENLLFEFDSIHLNLPSTLSPTIKFNMNQLKIYMTKNAFSLEEANNVVDISGIELFCTLNHQHTQTTLNTSVENMKRPFMHDVDQIQYESANVVLCATVEEVKVNIVKEQFLGIQDALQEALKVLTKPLVELSKPISNEKTPLVQEKKEDYNYCPTLYQIPETVIRIKIGYVSFEISNQIDISVTDIKLRIYMFSLNSTRNSIILKGEIHGTIRGRDMINDKQFLQSDINLYTGYQEFKDKFPVRFQLEMDRDNDPDIDLMAVHIKCYVSGFYMKLYEDLQDSIQKFSDFFLDPDAPQPKKMIINIDDVSVHSILIDLSHDSGIRMMAYLHKVDLSLRMENPGWYNEEKVLQTLNIQSNISHVELFVRHQCTKPIDDLSPLNPHNIANQLETQFNMFPLGCVNDIRLSLIMNDAEEFYQSQPTMAPILLNISNMNVHLELTPAIVHELLLAKDIYDYHQYKKNPPVDEESSQPNVEEKRQTIMVHEKTRLYTLKRSKPMVIQDDFFSPPSKKTKLTTMSRKGWCVKSHSLDALVHDCFQVTNLQLDRVQPVPKYMNKRPSTIVSFNNVDIDLELKGDDVHDDTYSIEFKNLFLQTTVMDDASSIIRFLLNNFSVKSQDSQDLISGEDTPGQPNKPFFLLDVELFENTHISIDTVPLKLNLPLAFIKRLFSYIPQVQLIYDYDENTQLLVSPSGDVLSKNAPISRVDDLSKIVRVYPNSSIRLPYLPPSSSSPPSSDSSLGELLCQISPFSFNLTVEWLVKDAILSFPSYYGPLDSLSRHYAQFSWNDPKVYSVIVPLLFSFMPFKPISNLSSATYQLIALPISEISSGHVIEGMTRGFSNFFHTVAVETIDLTSSVMSVAGVGVEAVRSRLGASSSSSSPSPSSSSNVVRLPHSFEDGAAQGFLYFVKGMNDVAEPVIAIPTAYRERGLWGVWSNLIVAVPNSVLSPLSGTVRGFSSMLVGLSRSLSH